jgi:hypothetical protein
MIERYRTNSTLIVLLGLATATLFVSWHLEAGPFASALVLGLAALKGRRILLDFLGLRAAPAVWRGLVTAWVIGVAAFAWTGSILGPLI